MENRNSKLIGIIIILVGLGYLAKELGFFENISFTPLIFGGAFLIIGVVGLFRKEAFMCVFGLGLCYYFTREIFALPEISFFTLLFIMILLSIGFSMLVTPTAKFVKAYSSDSGNILNVVMGEGEKYINDQDFKSFASSCVMGEAKLFFSDALITGDEAFVNVRTIMGESTLFVPKNWDVELRVNTVLGEAKCKGNCVSHDKKLIVSGNTVMGELQIVYI